MAYHPTTSNSTSDTSTINTMLPDVAIVVVTYHPQGDILARLDLLAQQSSQLIIVDNGSGPPIETQLFNYTKNDPTHRTFLPLGQNKGIAAALNVGLEKANSLGYRWALTMDQDTRPATDLLAHLKQIADEVQQTKPAIVAANYLDSTGKPYIKTTDSVQWSPAKTAITSGSLVNIQAWHQLNGYREDFFIDSVDHDFCFRCRFAGWQIIQCERPLMQHQLGQTNRRVWFMGLRPAVANYPPLRRYYMTRNRVAMFKTHWRNECWWTSKELAMIAIDAFLIVLYEPFKYQKLQAMGRGLWHGMIGQMGVADKMK